MKNLLTLLFIVSTVVAQAQYKETRKIDAHTAITVSTSLEVEYIKSNKNEVVIECANKEHLELILTDVNNETLHIRYKPNTSIRTTKANKLTVYSSYGLEKAKVSASGTLIIKDPIQTDLFLLEANSSGDIKTNMIKANKITIQASSSADIHTNLNVKTLNIDVSSSADASVTGQANNVLVNMSSSADVDLLGLTIENLSINGSSSSDLVFNTANNLNSNLSSSASVLYKKTPSNITSNKRASGATLGKK